MAEPVRLVSATEAAPGTVMASYHYAYAGGRSCDGSAVVEVISRAGQRLIASVHPLNGC